MDLKDLQRNWDEFGRVDPLWAIITLDGKRGRQWKPSEFFALGEREIGDLMAEVRGLGRTLGTRRALDFGCGVGRLTQALARHFDEVYGVDIAPSMIAQAREFNRHGDRAVYVLNERDDLRVLDAVAPFDLVYSNITLQHMEPRYAIGYVREFLRLLAPSGIAVFQIPGARTAPPPPSAPPMSRRLKTSIRRWLPSPLLSAYRRLRPPPPPPRPRPPQEGPRMEMYCISREEIERLVTAEGARVLSVAENLAAGPEFLSYRYYVAAAT